MLQFIWSDIWSEQQTELLGCKDESASQRLVCTCHVSSVLSSGDCEEEEMEVQEEQTILSTGCNDPLLPTLNQAI